MAGLILSRKENEEIVIGAAGDVLDAPIIVCIERLQGNAAKVRVVAGRQISVRRRELHERIQAENSRPAVPVGSEPGSHLGSEAAPHEVDAEPRRAG